MSAFADAEPGTVLLALYDEALPCVYGYLRRRVDGDSAAEDLTSETFVAAVTTIHQRIVHEVTIAWLMGIARHKLLDHYRRSERELRNLRAVESSIIESLDPWTTALRDDLVAITLADLGAHHRCALTLRHLDGLPVPEVARALGRSIHATEALLSRARVAFRSTYEAHAERERADDVN